MLQKMVKLFRKSIEERDVKLNKDEIHWIKLLHETDIPIHEISLSLDKSVTRINYEIKQLEAKGLLND